MAKRPSILDMTARGLENKGPVTYPNSKVKFNQSNKAVCGNCGKVFKSCAEERLLAAIYNSDQYCSACIKLEGFGKVGCAACGQPIKIEHEVLINKLPFHSSCAASQYSK
jgi:hypothetical protein